MRQRALLLDRDGVVNVELGHAPHRVEEFAFMPGLFSLLHAAQERGYRLAIATNQADVGRGVFTVEAYNALTDWMLAALRREGIAIDLVLACFEHPAGRIAPHARASYWRKPNPGMILEAAQRLRLDLPRSIMIGDRERDMQAAQAAGVGRCWLLGEGETALPGVRVIRDLAQARVMLEAD